MLLSIKRSKNLSALTDISRLVVSQSEI
ncbi:hypothetical protein EMIT0158MI4_100318 [Burkholderia ambifaria]